MSDNKYTSCTLIRQFPKLYPSFFDIEAGDWLFLLHTLNFSLWIPNSTKQWTVNNYTGFWALCAAIKRAIDDNKLIWDPNYYMTIAPMEMKHIFRGDDEIILPYLEERRIILHHVGKTLKKKYGGLFINCIRKSEYDADKLMKILFKFESYQDEIMFHGKPIRLYTKAKLLISDLQTYFPISSKSSIKTSTLLKDYRAVQVLLHFGAIRYTENLQLLLRICAVALKERDAQHRLTERTEMELGRPGAEVQSSAVECYYGGVGQARMRDCNKFGRINDVAEE
ncbi:QSPP protein, partial [Pseudoatta argentina]